MRVVIATPFYPPQGGVLAVYAKGLEEAFKRQGAEVVVAVLPKYLPPGLRHLVYYFRVLRAARGARFVLALDTWSVGVPALRAAQKAHVPFAVRIGGDFLWELYIARTHAHIPLSHFYTKPRSRSFRERLVARAIRTILTNADAIFFNTKFQKDIWEEAYAFPLEKSHLLENYYPKVESFPAKGRVFVSTARGAAFKNLEVLEDAFRHVKNIFPDVELDTRSLPHEAHLARLENAYAVIVPSISEVGSNTVIDGLSKGKPFIITNDTGVKERLLEYGLFTNTGNEKDLAKTIFSLLERETYARYVNRIKNFSFTHSWDDLAREIVEKI